MSDYSKDFTTEATNASYPLPSPLLAGVGLWRTTNGSGLRMRTGGSGLQYTAYHDVTYGSLIQSDVTEHVLGTGGDNVWSVVMVRTGANALKGYLAQQDGSQLKIFFLTATGAAGTQIGSSGTAGAKTIDDTITLIYNTATGDLTAKKNGSTLVSTNDTTYAAETTLAAGFGYTWGNTDSAFIGTFAGTGVASSASSSIIFNATLNQRETSITLQTYGTSSTG